MPSYLEAFWTQNIKGEEGFDRADSMLEGLGAGWTASFLANVYPSLSRYLINEFLQAVVELSIVELLALFVTFGAESFVRGPAILLTEVSAEFAIRWTSNVNCKNTRKLGRIDQSDTLPGADKGEREEI